MSHMMHEEIDVNKINLSYFCRRCKETVRGIPETKPVYHISEFDDDPWLVVRCPNRLCELSFVIYNRLNDRIFQVFPLAGFEPDDYHQAIPKMIREDIAEADKCYYAGAYMGTVVMLRRAVQHIVIDKIKDETIRNKKLWEQIDALFTEGFITKQLKESAHEIRHFGNFGAHPTDDNLDKTTSDDAKIIDRLTHDLLRAIYITPFETEELKSKRTRNS